MHPVLCRRTCPAVVTRAWDMVRARHEPKGGYGGLWAKAGDGQEG